MQFLVELKFYLDCPCYFEIPRNSGYPGFLEKWDPIYVNDTTHIHLTIIHSDFIITIQS